MDHTCELLLPANKHEGKQGEMSIRQLEVHRHAELCLGSNAFAKNLRNLLNFVVETFHWNLHETKVGSSLPNSVRSTCSSLNLNNYCAQNFRSKQRQLHLQEIALP